MNKEFVMRGKTASGTTEVLNFSGNTPGFAYRLVEFNIYPSSGIGTANQELMASITAAKTFEDPQNPNFNNEGLIATALFHYFSTAPAQISPYSVVNDTFLITQDLILSVLDSFAGSPADVNWQCRFVAEKMNTSEEAVTNYKQFTISND